VVCAWKVDAHDQIRLKSADYEKSNKQTPNPANRYPAPAFQGPPSYPSVMFISKLQNQQSVIPFILYYICLQTLTRTILSSKPNLPNPKISSSASPPSSSHYAPTPEDLARKRARGRKSQRAMRDRTKYSMFEPQSRVMELCSTLADQTAAFQDLLQTSTSQAAALRAENQRLKNKLEESKYVGSDMCLENFRFPRSDSMLSELPMLRPLPQRQGRDPAQILPGAARTNDEVPAYLRLPVNCAPICLSDRILQSYVQARRNGTKDITQVVTDQPAWLPDINALLTPQAPKPSIDNRSVSTVVSDILLSYHEINTLPRKVAVLDITYKLLNVSLTPVVRNYSLILK
jgi:hypothetical protein